MSTPMTLAPLLGRVLSGDVTVSEHRTDQRIIDAVIAELRVTPLRKLSLEDVARRAGLTRMTVYRRFGDRDAVIEAAMAREVSRFLEGVLAAIDLDAAPGEQIAEAFATALQLAHGHPVIAHLLATGPGELLEILLADDGFVLTAGSAFLGLHIQRLAGLGADAPDPQRTGEVLGRLFVALVLMPPPSVDLTDPGQARQLARDLIAPLIVPADQ